MGNEQQEKLIESAAKAMYRLTNSLSVSGARDLARAAFAVYEEACTPTDDEREALISEADELVAAWDLRGSWSPDSPVGLVMRFAAYLRRTVQGEPADAQKVEFPFTLGNVTLEQEDGGMWVVITETPRNRTYWIEPGVLIALRAAFNETGENR